MRRALFIVGIFCVSLAHAREPIAYSIPLDRRDSIVLVLWNGQTTDDQLKDYFARIRTVGARHVTVPYFGCQTDSSTSDVGGCEHTIQPLMDRAARLAVQEGMTVSLLPIVLSLSGEWRGFFNPKDPDQWFVNYGEWMKKVARVARDLKSPDLVVGSEFGPLYKFTEKWKSLLRELRQNHFSGPLVVTVNWDMPSVGFWEEADAIGVSSYFPLSAVKQPSDAELLAGAQAVKQKLTSLAKTFSRPLHLTEVGYPSYSGASSMPWGIPAEKPGEKPQVDWQIQAACYRAFVSTWKSTPELVHVGFWATGETAGNKADYGYEFFGKPAQAVLSGFFQF